MNIFSRTMGAFSSRNGAPEAGFEAGRSRRRLGGLPVSTPHVNTLTKSAGKTLSARARYLERNVPYATSAVATFASSVVGTGIIPQAEIKSSSQRKKIQEAWRDWSQDCDFDEVSSFSGLQYQGAREFMIAGEFFARMHFDTEKTVPFSVQLLPSEMCPHNLDRALPGGSYVKQGIEFSKEGKRVAYYFLKVNPGDTAPVLVDSSDTVRVPAKDVVHVFDKREVGQIRGYSKFSSAIAKIFQLDLYDDAELQKKQLAAAITGFIKSDREDNLDGDRFGEEVARENGVSDVEITPGQLNELNPGEDVEFAKPAESGDSYQPFMYRTLLAISVALGLPYHQMSGDAGEGNYGSLRAQQTEFRRHVDALQEHVFNHQFNRPIWRRFVEMAHFAGLVKISGWNDPKTRTSSIKVLWLAPAWAWIDPEKDGKAQVLNMRWGIIGRSHVQQSLGLNPEDADERISEDKRRAEQLGLSFPVADKPVIEKVKEAGNEPA